MRVPSSAALQRQRLENGTVAAACSRRRRVGSRDRLERRVPGRERGREAAQCRLELVLADTRRPDELGDAQTRLGERAGLVEADDRGRCERLDRVELLRKRTVPGELEGAREVDDAREQDQPFGDEVDHRGDDGGEGVVERRVAQPERQGEGGAERDAEHDQHHDQPVEAALERRRRVPERARLAGEPLGVALVADGGCDVGAGALDCERAGEEGVSHPACHRRRLAGQDRLVDLAGRSPTPRRRRRRPGRPARAGSGRRRPPPPPRGVAVGPTAAPAREARRARRAARARALPVSPARNRSPRSRPRCRERSRRPARRAPPSRRRRRRGRCSGA